MKTQAQNQLEQIKFRNETKQFFSNLTLEEKVTNQPDIGEVINFFHLVITRKLKHRPTPVRDEKQTNPKTPNHRGKLRL